MTKKIINLLILLPLGVILIIFCVANRQNVTLAFIRFDRKIRFFPSPRLSSSSC